MPERGSDADVEFRILGPVEAVVGGRPVDLGPPKRRLLLALLLLECGRSVPVDRLVDLAWEAPPPAARRVVFAHIARLRQALTVAELHGVRLLSTPPGYTLQADPAQVDAHLFRSRVTEAAAAGDPAERADLLRAALGLWRGPALGDLAAGPGPQRLVQGLEDLRLSATEDRIDAELAAGRHAVLLGELAEMVAQHPIRERLAGQLMLAQYRCGNTGAALDVYRRTRADLAAELGLDPGPELDRLHDAILRRDPALGAPAPAVRSAFAAAVPAQLPPAVAAFTGRDEQLMDLDRLLPDGEGAAAIGVISGTAGVGKTALAVHWAHRVRERFSDGQLYVNLRGYAPSPPLRPVEALAGFLQALGTSAEEVPADTDQAGALYRTLLAGKRMLVVLDNASSAGQVRPLLPGSPGCVVLVTSRDRLAGVVARDGARHLTLDVLGHDEAVTLVARILGAQRVRAEPAQSAELADRCGRLPLALRIAAANLATHPRRRIAEQVADLAADHRLSALEIDGDEQSAIRLAFDLSYDALAEPARLLFRRLGLVPGPDFTAPAAAALAECTPAEARRLLDRLASAHLVQQDDDRYTLHDLLRLYARERTDREDTAGQRDSAIGRVCDWYLATADAAARQLYPTAVRLTLPETAAPAAAFDDHTAALAWLDAEVANLVAAIQHGAGHRPRSVAWLLADTLRGYFMLRVLPVEWAAAAAAALAAAEADDDPQAQMAAELSLAGLHQRQNRFSPAIEHYRRALAINQRAGWPAGQSAALGNLGTVYLSTGRPREAAGQFAQALAIDRRIGWRGGQAAKLGNLGVASRHLGRLDEAAAHLREALTLFRELGSPVGEALAMANLGAVLHLLGRYPEAAAHLTRAAALHREVGDRSTQADDENLLAEVHRDAGRLSAALDLAEAALTQAAEVGERHYEADALNVIGSVQLRLGAPRQAEEHHRRALDLASRTSTQLPEATALIGLADACRRLGDPEQARQYAIRAAALSRTRDYRILEGQARVALATALTDQGRHARAASQARLALRIHHTTGYRLGAAQAHTALGHALARSDRDTALAHWKQADQIRTDIGAADQDAK